MGTEEVNGTVTPQGRYVSSLCFNDGYGGQATCAYLVRSISGSCMEIENIPWESLMHGLVVGVTIMTFADMPPPVYLYSMTFYLCIDRMCNVIISKIHCSGVQEAHFLASMYWDNPDTIL